MLRRLLLLLPTVLGVTALAFCVAHLAPGDAAMERFRRVEGRPPTTEELLAERRELGLDGPLVGQYLHWVGRAAQGDLGTSFTGGFSVGTELLGRMRLTVELTAVAAVLALAMGIPAGVLGAVYHNRVGDHLLRVASLGGASIPSFWLGLLLLDLFAVRLSLVPVAGQNGLSIVLPAMTLAVGSAAVLARFTRAAVLETLGEDYLRTARAKGLTGYRVVVRHALRPALVPVVTQSGMILGQLLGGAMIVETIFSWPGLGQLSIDAVIGRDYPVIQGVVLYVGVTVALLNLVVDLSYSSLDPRVRLEGRGALR